MPPQRLTAVVQMVEDPKAHVAPFCTFGCPSSPSSPRKRGPRACDIISARRTDPAIADSGARSAPVSFLDLAFHEGSHLPWSHEIRQRLTGAGRSPEQAGRWHLIDVAKHGKQGRWSADVERAIASACKYADAWAPWGHAPIGGSGSPLLRRAVRGKFSCKDNLHPTRKKRFQVVLRGLDPRIHVFFRPPRGVDGRAKPGQDEIWE